MESYKDEGMGEGTGAPMEKRSLLDRATGSLFTLVVFLLPFFFWPFGDTPVEISKRVLLGVGTLIVFALWLLSRLEKGNVAFPRGLVTTGLVVLPVAGLASALFSGGFAHSFFGLGFETTSAIALFIWSIVALLSSVYLRKEGRLSTFFKVLLAGQIIASVILLLHLMLPDMMTGIFRSPIDTVIGKWNDFGLYSGLVVILAMLGLSFKDLRIPRVLAWTALVTSSIGLIFVNLSLIWTLLALGSLALFIYSVLGKSRDEFAGVSAGAVMSSPVAIFLLSVLFLFAGGTNRDGSQQFLAEKITSYENSHGIISLEARPSWGATMGVVSDVASKSLFFGSGPNNFGREWQKSKPDAVNESIFWDVDFGGGYGFIPSAFVTMGLFGILAWLLVVGGFFFTGLRRLYQLGRTSDRFDYLLAVFFLGTYLWITALFYVPDNVLLALAFVVTGIMSGLLSDWGIIRSAHIRFEAATRARFIGVFATVVMAIVSLSGAYVLSQKLYAVSLFQEGAALLAQGAGKADAAADIFSQAVGLSREDLYYRSLAQVSILQFSQVINATGIAPEAAQTQFAALFKKAYDYADTAVKIDPENFENYVTLGKVYEAVVPLKVAGSYEAASGAYKTALEKNPKSPLVYLNLARLEYTHDSNAKAREYVSAGLAKKSNYAELIFLASQIEAKDGNLAKAIPKAEQAALLAPNDIGVWFQVGALKYANKDYRNAALALEEAVRLNGNYSNAHYFLGLAYEKLGDKERTLGEFEKVLALNPDNAEVKQIVANLKAGRPSYEGPSAPAPEPVKAETPKKK